MKEYTVEDLNFTKSEASPANWPETIICTACGKPMCAVDTAFVCELPISEDSNYLICACSQKCVDTLQGHGNIPPQQINAFLKHQTSQMK